MIREGNGGGDQWDGRQEEKGVSLKVSGSYVGRIRVFSEFLGRFLWAHHEHSKFLSFFRHAHHAART